MDPTNPFLVLRLPANATSADIKRVGQMAVAAARLSGDSSGDAQRRLKDIESAVERLRDPVARIRYGVSWPALSAAGAERLRTDPKFAEIAVDPAADCSQALDAMLNDEPKHVQAHARAVFMLLRASAILRARVRWREHAGALPAWGYEIGCRMLEEGLGHWSRALEQREFWLECRLRAKELGDPRVDSAFLSELESDAAKMPLVQFAGVASELLRVRDSRVCKSLVDAMRRGTSNKAHLETELAEVYGPTCTRIGATLEGLESELKPLKAKEAAPYVSLLQRYEKDVAPDVDMLLEVGDLPGYAEEMVRDKATQFLRSLAVESANNAHAFEVSDRALGFASRAANSANLRATIADDQKTVSNLVAQSNAMAKAGPFAERLQQAMQANDRRAAIEALDGLIPLAPPEEMAELRLMRQRLSTNYASQLYNEAMARIRVRDRSGALQLLLEARRYETVPRELAIIDKAISVLQQPVRAQSGGCLIPIAIVIGTAGIALPSVLKWLPALLGLVAGFFGTGSGGTP